MAYAFVAESEASTSASGTSIAVSLATNPTAGNLLHVVGFQAVNGVTITFTDSLSNTFSTTQAIGEAAIASTLSDGYAANITGGADTVTASFGGSGGYRGIYVLEISGLKTSAVLDGNGAATDTGTNPTAATTCTNTSQPGVMLSFVWGIQSDVTVGTGMTLRTANLWAAMGTGGQPIIQYKNISSVASHTADAENGGLSRTVSVASLYLEDTGGGGGGTFQNMVGSPFALAGSHGLAG